MRNVEKMSVLFKVLQSTNYSSEKLMYVNAFKRENPDAIEDFMYVFETLDGRHPIGWTMRNASYYEEECKFSSIKEAIMACEKCPKDFVSTINMEKALGPYIDFIRPIVNRTLKLGIGRSILGLENIITTPMLAKKYDGSTLPFNYCYATEKLDGNRCIAKYDPEKRKWKYLSRSGKTMTVSFDMSGLSTDYVYDGEIMSVEQTIASEKRYDTILNDKEIAKFDTKESQLMFNKTSGLINRKEISKGLVYNIFDIIIPDETYERRRTLLDSFAGNVSADVRILPLLYIGYNPSSLDSLLESIILMGGEGIMLNNPSAMYEHKRSGNLLKYKQVQFMDMLVYDIEYGQGKYEGLVGALCCSCVTDDGKKIDVKVGSGLSDAQRFLYAVDKSNIVGKIIQVGYHEITQNSMDSSYSLRFPRFIKVRKDKSTTSEY